MENGELASFEYRTCLPMSRQQAGPDSTAFPNSADSAAFTDSATSTDF